MNKITVLIGIILIAIVILSGCTQQKTDASTQTADKVLTEEKVKDLPDIDTKQLDDIASELDELSDFSSGTEGLATVGSSASKSSQAATTQK